MIYETKILCPVWFKYFINVKSLKNTTADSAHFQFFGCSSILYLLWYAKAKTLGYVRKNKNLKFSRRTLKDDLWRKSRSHSSLCQLLSLRGGCSFQIYQENTANMIVIRTQNFCTLFTF